MNPVIRDKKKKKKKKPKPPASSKSLVVQFVCSVGTGVVYSVFWGWGLKKKKKKGQLFKKPLFGLVSVSREVTRMTSKDCAPAGA